MNLQLDKILFTDTITAASIELSIPVDFVEKDYWITLVLSRLANTFLKLFSKEEHHYQKDTICWNDFRKMWILPL